MALEPQLLPRVTRQQSNCNIFVELKTPTLLDYYLHNVFLLVHLVIVRG